MSECDLFCVIGNPFCDGLYFKKLLMSIPVGVEPNCLVSDDIGNMSLGVQGVGLAFVPVLIFRHVALPLVSNFQAGKSLSAMLRRYNN